MKYKITLQYEVDAPTQIDALRKIHNNEIIMYTHIKTEKEDED
tara:strand:- start:352 stop:480 length:129 start_codon:yes stop_codon:yes gene_type:complete